MTTDLLIRDARLRERAGRVWNVRTSNGVIREITDAPLEADMVVEAEGNLLTPAFTNPHLHLDKVHTLHRVGEEALTRYSGEGMGQAMSAIAIAARVKAEYEESWIYESARAALIDGVRHGVLRVRAFADTDTSAGLEGIKALLRLRDELTDLVEVEVVAFPQDGILRDPGAEEVVRQALELGADVVGGIPWIELTDADAQRHVDIALDLGQEFDRDVVMLVDDAGDPSLRTTEMLAVGAVKRGWERRISACHARALATYARPTLERLIGLASKAGMSFVTNPHTGPLHLPMLDMLDAGLTVALGQDDIVDAYYPYGQHSMLEVAFLASHVLHRYTMRDMDRFFDMITVHAARAMGADAPGVHVGAPADLVILEGDTVHEALRLHAAPRSVIRRGRLVAENSSQSIVNS